MIVYLIGAGPGAEDVLTGRAREAIRSCELLVGAPRLLEPFQDLPVQRHALVKTADIVSVLRASSAATACVLLSGDVGFYSGAAALRRALDGFDVRALPGVSSVQYLCAQVGVGWDDAFLASAHGRACDVAALVRQHGKVLLLTGGDRKAHDLCRDLARAGLGDTRVTAGERLSYPDERIVSGSAEQLADQEFLDLSVLLLQRPLPEDLPGARRFSGVVVASPRSGAGKTSFTCGLLRALQRRGLSPLACKCGPDYIDPLFHRSALGVPARNLDPFMMGPAGVRSSFARAAAACDVAVVEGAMGYYDGIASSDESSTWDVARTLGAPTILVVDARGQARSCAAEVLGFTKLRADHGIAGVVLNRVSASYYPQLKRVIEAETGLPVLGFLPKLDDAGFESRHLGLVAADELPDVQRRLDALADAIEDSVDVDALLTLAHDAVVLVADDADEPQPVTGEPLIAVARDEAFCFYYEDTLQLFERLGARLVPFSPLRDAALPAGASGLYLGGGYPELHARALSQNESMCQSVKAALASGMPAIAECGGFMYLHDQLEDEDGKPWPLVGAIPGTAFRTTRLGRFGYVELTAQIDNLLCAAGERLRGHEFHYWDSDNAGAAFRAEKPQSARSWSCVHATPTLYAGYPHVCLHANPPAARRFVQACARFAGETRPSQAANSDDAQIGGLHWAAKRG